MTAQGGPARRPRGARSISSGAARRIGSALTPLVAPVLALVTAFLIGAVVIVVTDVEHMRLLGTDPAGAIGGAIDVVVRGYGAMVAGAIGDPGRILAALQTGDPSDVAGAIRPLSEALVAATPYVFVGLGLAVAFHAGLLNLGGDGQFEMGAFGAGATASLVGGLLPGPATLVAALLGGTLAGAAYGFIPGFLKARTGAHEVITTLMLNAIAPGLILLLAQSGLFSGPPGPIPSVPPLIDMPTIRVDWGFVVSLAMAVVVSVLLFRTALGFELRATGFSASASRFAGMRPGRTTMVAMAVSGGLAGMGSAFMALGPGSPGGVGFVALALALLAGLRPSGVVLVALLYGALNNGAKQMVIETGIPLALLVVVIALAVMFIAAPKLIRSIWRVPLRQRADDITSPRQLGQGEAL